MQDLKRKFISVFDQWHKMRGIMMKEDSMPFAEMKMLSHIKILSERQKEVTVSDIKCRLPITKPAISQALNTLENKGYIHRTISPGDRRAVALEMTEKGNKVIKEQTERMDHFLDRLIEEVGMENIEKMIELLELFQTKIQEISQSEER